MSDVFLEVDEQLRAERAEQWLRRGWPYAAAVLAAALVLALGYWAWDSYSKSRDDKASVAYAHALEAQGAGKTADAEKAYQDLSTSAPSEYRALALMQLAGLRQGAHKDAEAVAFLDKAGATTHDKLLKDAAAYKAAMLTLDTAPLAETRRRLEPLTAAGRPYRNLAREALGVAKLAAGKGAEARGDFAALSLSPEISDAARARARAALGVIDSGTAAGIPATIKAAAALPDSALIAPPVGALPPGVAPQGAPQAAPAQ